MLQLDLSCPSHSQAIADYKLSKQREMMEEEDRMARRRDDDNRRKAMEDERVKAAIRQKAGECTIGLVLVSCGSVLVYSR